MKEERPDKIPLKMEYNALKRIILLTLKMDLIYVCVCGGGRVRDRNAQYIPLHTCILTVNNSIQL